jgi:hypothetical protein
VKANRIGQEGGHKCRRFEQIGTICPPQRLKNLAFLGFLPGTDSALRVGFGDGFGVKLAALWAGESSLRPVLSCGKHFK